MTARSRPARHRERGSISPAAVLFAISTLAAAGLALDGGRKLNALGEARDLADNAARVGAQQVDVDAYRATGDVVLDSGEATAAASDYLAATGHSGTAAVATDTITVTVTITFQPTFLPGPMTVTVSETATAEASVVGG